MNNPEIKYLNWLIFAGSYVCSFNGSKDLRCIDSNTNIHIYVFDDIHLLKRSGFDFQQSVQYETAEIQCTPTHPNVSVSLFLQGRGLLNVDDKYITFSLKVITKWIENAIRILI